MRGFPVGKSKVWKLWQLVSCTVQIVKLISFQLCHGPECMACLKGSEGRGGSRRGVCFEQGVCFEREVCMQRGSGARRRGEENLGCEQSSLHLSQLKSTETERKCLLGPVLLKALSYRPGEASVGS